MFIDNEYRIQLVTSRDVLFRITFLVPVILMVILKSRCLSIHTTFTPRNTTRHNTTPHHTTPHHTHHTTSPLPKHTYLNTIEMQFIIHTLTSTVWLNRRWSFRARMSIQTPLVYVYVNNHDADTVNSLWHSDAIWRQRSGSTLAKVMACCLTSPSHYLNQWSCRN